jgi:hypothetical protein
MAGDPNTAVLIKAFQLPPGSVCRDNAAVVFSRYLDMPDTRVSSDGQTLWANSGRFVTTSISCQNNFALLITLGLGGDNDATAAAMEKLIFAWQQACLPFSCSIYW